jgi:hypothetical protein
MIGSTGALWIYAGVSMQVIAWQGFCGNPESSLNLFIQRYQRIFQLCDTFDEAPVYKY